MVAYASQTGTAKEIAERSVEALGRERAALLPMSQLTPRQLLNHRRVLFVVSTYGEGDPPDPAQAFYRQACAVDAPALNHLETAVLALGDSSYRHYCGFGQTLASWLARQGATLLFQPVLADKCDPAALRSWSNALSQQFQATTAIEKPYTDWRLVRRRHMNPGSVGGACYELSFEAAIDTLPFWQAGDIAEVAIDQYGLHREYSIASTPGEGMLKLLLRQRRDTDGRLGIGSRWLTEELETGAIVRIHLRENALFHAPDQAVPAIFIGNGTGIAGLRSLLKRRLEQGNHENWLIFGERQSACDLHYRDELERWLAEKRLARLDLAFSRDQTPKRYVHHVLAEAQAEIREWVARDAIIYVCGSKNGMASDVDGVLRQALGGRRYAALIERRGYRRDIY
ncbi:sulfite reductase subunit alpha [Pollutimonas sp. H1-120]|uniref:sulfite reductase subunit alpha n=1 Tax=Pollutimonas sp. H1-120 TaxID=3148824 RepID=UPI003B5186DD